LLAETGGGNPRATVHHVIAADEMNGRFDRIEDGEMVEGRNRFGAAESADSPAGYADASGPDLAIQYTFNEAGDRPAWHRHTTADGSAVTDGRR
jgi:hypothetical protein